MFRVYIADTNLRPLHWTVTDDARAALEAFKTLLGLDRADGAAVLSRDGVVEHLSRFDLPLGAGRLSSDELAA